MASPTIHEWANRALKAEVERIEGQLDECLTDCDTVGYYGDNLESAMQCWRETVMNLRAENVNFDRHAQERAREHAREVERLRAALAAVAGIGGNLPDESLTTRTGPNDSVHRGNMYCHSRAIARKALEPRP